MGNNKISFESFKKFFELDVRMKETLFRLAPNEYDDFNEESRIKYADRLYSEFEKIELEFVEIAKDFAINSTMVQKLKEHFNELREKFLIGQYNPGVIQRVYRDVFATMNPQLVDEIKGGFVGYKLSTKKNLDKFIEKSQSINELLHVLHLFITNNEQILQQLPVIETKKNNGESPITLYGEETEFSRKLFEKFPLELDCGYTDIISMKSKILMMIRDRGHALTIDIDTSKEEDVLVKYFVPKLCNQPMIEALPGINKSSISENGATGLFEVSKLDIFEKLFSFIDKVPTDKDIPCDYDIGDDRRRFQEELRNGVGIINHNSVKSSNENAIELEIGDK